MQDLMLRQVQHRIVDYHRMMARVNGNGDAATPPAPRASIRVAVAQPLLSLAAWLAPPTRRTRVVKTPTEQIGGW